VQLRQELGADAGTAVEVVCVLRYEEAELAEPLELGEGEVGGVGLDPVRRHPLPRRRQAGVPPRPHALGTAEVGYAGVGADARASEGDDVVALDDPPSDRLDLLVEAVHDGFPIFQAEAPTAGVRNSLQRTADLREDRF
jgi:hypothetical protein